MNAKSSYNLSIAKKNVFLPFSAALLIVSLLPWQDASAQRRFAARGANGGAAGFGTRFASGGGAGGFAGRFKNSAAGGYAMKSEYGSAAGGAVATPYGGGGFHRANLAGPNGGNFQSSGNSAYKPGVGAESQGAFSGTAANGASGAGNHNMQYNAQTGQGTQNAAAQFTSASGQNYGGSESSSFTKGQGGSTDINTDNHGSYDVNWAKGQKPVVTSTGSSQ